MAGRRVYGGSNMATLLQSEGIPAETIEALLSPGSNPGGFLVSRNMVNFEDVCGNTSERPSFYRPFDLEENVVVDEELDESLHQPEKKRRLTTDQVRFLEKSFELENKLEPERKIQLARDLGLQPRQVAIWFQNRRARWKTKQLEKDYEALKINFNVLKTDHDNLLKEKEKLKAEIVSLTEKLMHKEKDKDDKGNKHASEFKNSINNEAVVETKRLDVQVSTLVCKQEDLSSTNSAVFDSDSSHYTDEVGHTVSSNAFEPDHSDLSHAEEDGEVKKYPFLKFEDNNSTDYGVPVVVEDQSFWFWNY
ncbi:homeobox-leucine zipper protein [Dioscorea alata]|uniref:Homeobox-leucine zipper protein n=1 Tax=Dioscorea alata TaxID=55571 RepID=A0ACB7W2J8_DIOAL|nr:homeobox-leucine zipper protein [Dioscorea alata]